MAPRKPPKPNLLDRTPVAEWVAAALGLVLTVAVLGYSLWEGLDHRDGPPRLSVSGEPARPGEGGFVLPFVVRNVSAQTAADVTVLGVLAGPRGTEERRASLSYVPGGGEARGGLVFRQDPAAGRLDLIVEGYEEP